MQEPAFQPDLDVTALLDERRLAERLGVSCSTLQSWRYTGRGPRYIKIGRLIRYQLSEVDAYIHAQTRGPSVGSSR
jgi:predicted DNA-binding transcriptional regulator AlpA